MLIASAIAALSLASAGPAVISDPGAAPLAAFSAATEVMGNHTTAVSAESAAPSLPGFPLATGAAVINPASLEPMKTESSRGFPISGTLPVIGFVLCGAAALFFAKKKQTTTSKKMLQIVETHSMGGRRQIIVARIAGETVLLGSSEAGLTLLLARPGETVGEIDKALAATSAPQPETEPARGKENWLGRLRLARTEETQDDPSFEELLAQDAAARAKTRTEKPAPLVEPALLRQPLDPDAESAEDQELRRKLSHGRAGRIA